jgi:hypothetical protein
MKDSELNSVEIIGVFLAAGMALVAVLCLGHGSILRSTKTVLLAAFLGGLLGRVIWNRFYPTKATETSVD